MAISKNKTFVLIIFYILTISCLNSWSASKNIDSLKTVIAQTSQNDTMLARLYFETGYAEYYDYNYDSAIVYYNKALAENINNEDKILEAKIHYYFGEMCLETGDFDLALEHYFKAIDFYNQDGFSRNLMNAYFGAALAYKSKGFYTVAISYYNLSLKQAGEAGDTLSMADIYNNMGTAEKNLGLYPESMAHLSDALKIYKNRGIKVHEFNVLNNIGSLLEEQGSYPRALEYYEQSLSLARETGDKYYMFVPLANTASIYSLLEKYDKALNLFKEALALADEINDNVRIADCYIELGNLMRKTGETEKALEYYTKAYKIAKDDGIRPTQTNALLNLSKISLRQKNFIKATELAAEALILSKNTQAKPLIAESLFQLYKIADNQGNYEKALQYHKNWIAVKDSLYSIKKTKAIEELEIQYQVKNKVEENNRLKTEAETMKLVLAQRKKANILLSFGIFLSIAVVILLVNQVKSRKKLQEQEKAIHRQKTENLNNKINHQQRDLVAKSISIAEKNSSLERIIRQIEEIIQINGSTSEKNRILKSVIRQIKFELKHKKHWEEFEIHFNSVHPRFYKNLNKQYPDLTVNERKLSAFLKLKLSSKDISAITGQSVKSVEVARSRLRKKLNLEREDNLFNLIEKI